MPPSSPSSCPQPSSATLRPWLWGEVAPSPQCCTVTGQLRTRSVCVGERGGAPPVITCPSSPLQSSPRPSPPPGYGQPHRCNGGLWAGQGTRPILCEGTHAAGGTHAGVWGVGEGGGREGGGRSAPFWGPAPTGWCVFVWERGGAGGRSPCSAYSTLPRYDSAL